MTTQTPVVTADDGAALADLYRDLHAHPELSHQERRTAQVVADSLRALGYDTTEGVGGTGVVGLLRRGAGPTVLLRADMDALPVQEQTGLPYASTVRALDPDGTEVSVMHACGHDMHVTCLLGAAARLAADPQWSGTLQVVFQPAEEAGYGARAMLDDGFLDRFGRPDVVLAQHVEPLPVGVIGLHPGPAFAAYDAVRVTLHGTGGHGSQPEACVDPILMAAAVVMRLQGIVAREISPFGVAVLTVGSLHAGTTANIIADTAQLQVSVRSYDSAVRARVLAAIDRVVHAEAQASGAPKPPTIETVDENPALVNDPLASARTARALASVVGAGRVIDPGPETGSEDAGMFATDAGVPCVYWLLGGAEREPFGGLLDDELLDPEAIMRVFDTLPSNHSPLYAPVPEPTIEVGVAALTAAAREWLSDRDRT